jgi:hypothetical protein
VGKKPEVSLGEIVFDEAQNATAVRETLAKEVFNF